MDSHDAFGLGLRKQSGGGSSRSCHTIKRNKQKSVTESRTASTPSHPVQEARQKPDNGCLFVMGPLTLPVVREQRSDHTTLIFIRHCGVICVNLAS